MNRKIQIPKKYMSFMTQIHSEFDINDMKLLLKTDKINLNSNCFEFELDFENLYQIRKQDNSIIKINGEKIYNYLQDNDILHIEKTKNIDIQQNLREKKIKKLFLECEK